MSGETPNKLVVMYCWSWLIDTFEHRDADENIMQMNSIESEHLQVCNLLLAVIDQVEW